MGSKHIQQLPTPPPDHRTVEVCEICGGIGNQENFLICPKCKISREHAYCRKILSRDDYDDWSCDDCKDEKIGLHENVNQNIKSSGYIYDKDSHFSLKGKNQIVEKIVTKGKVICIPSQEAIKLSSGSRRGEAPVKAIKQLESSPLRIGKPMSPKASIHQKGLPLKSPVASVPLPSNKQTDSVNKRSKTSHDPKEMKAIQASRKELIQMAEPVAIMASPKTKHAGLVKETSIQREALISPALEKSSARAICSVAVKPAIGTKLACSVAKISKPSEASSLCPQEKQFLPPISSVEAKVASPRKEASVPKEASCSPLLKKQFMKPSRSGNQVSGDLYPKVSDVDNCVLKNTELKSENFYRVPALDSSWKGRFELLVDTFQNVYFDIEAHPCARGSRKVLDCSKRMPQLLQFTTIHQKEVWGNLFQDGCPNEDHIGLYFYSTEDKRSSGYDLILMFIEAQEFAMRCVLSGVELYIFTSKTLPADLQKLDDEFFLWGIFRKLKKHKHVSELYKELPPAVHKLSDSPRNNEVSNDDDDHVVDMEIDMIGGQDLEEMRVVPRDSSVGFKNPFPLQEIKKEALLDCPPGFEEIYRMKIRKF